MTQSQDTKDRRDAERRAVEFSREIAVLLQRRPDLVGVHALADLAADGVRWCA